MIVSGNIMNLADRDRNSIGLMLLTAGGRRISSA